MNVKVYSSLERKHELKLASLRYHSEWSLLVVRSLEQLEYSKHRLRT